MIDSALVLVPHRECTEMCSISCPHIRYFFIVLSYMFCYFDVDTVFFFSISPVLC